MMQITTKGQVTIPQEIREKFGFLPHSQVEFQIEKNRVYLVKLNTKSPGRGQHVIEKMRGKGNVQLSTDEIMALTRDE